MLSGISQIISRHLSIRQADFRSLTSPGLWNIQEVIESGSWAHSLWFLPQAQLPLKFQFPDEAFLVSACTQLRQQLYPMCCIQQWVAFIPVSPEPGTVPGTLQVHRRCFLNSLELIFGRFLLQPGREVSLGADSKGRLFPFSTHLHFRTVGFQHTLCKVQQNLPPEETLGNPIFPFPFCGALRIANMPSTVPGIQQALNKHLLNK